MPHRARSLPYDADTVLAVFRSGGMSWDAAAEAGWRPVGELRCQRVSAATQ